MWIPTWHRMDHVSWSFGLFSKTTSWRQAQHKTGKPWHSERSQLLIYSILSCVRTHMNRNLLKQHLVEGPVTYDFTLHLRVRDHTYMILEVSWDGLWTLPFGLSQFHGHGSWLVCEEKTNPQGDKEIIQIKRTLSIVQHGMPLLVGILSLLLRPRLSLAGLTSPVSHVAKVFLQYGGPRHTFSIHIASCECVTQHFFP